MLQPDCPALSPARCLPTAVERSGLWKLQILIVDARSRTVSSLAHLGPAPVEQRSEAPRPCLMPRVLSCRRESLPDTDVLSFPVRKTTGITTHTGYVTRTAWSSEKEGNIRRGLPVLNGVLCCWSALHVTGALPQTVTWYSRCRLVPSGTQKIPSLQTINFINVISSMAFSKS